MRKRCNEPQWHEMLEPMLKIDGKTITRKEGMMLCIAAESEELHEWQREKLKLSRSDYRKIDWAAQHAALAKLPRKNAPIFCVLRVPLAPRGSDDQAKQSTRRGQMSLMR